MLLVSTVAVPSLDQFLLLNLKSNLIKQPYFNDIFF